MEPNHQRIPFDDNRKPFLTALSYLDGNTSVPLLADPATGRLLTSSSGGAAGTQYAEGATTSPGTGTLSIGRYNLVAPSLTDGELFGLQLDNSGNLKVTGSLSVGGTTDNSAFTAGTSTGTPAMGFYHSTIDAVTDGRSAAIAITANRAQHSNLRNASGTEMGTVSNPLQVSIANTGANATAVKVDGSGVTQPVSLTSTTITGSVTVAQATASNLNATVVGTGTFATQAAQSGTWNITNVSGTVSLPTGASTSAKQPALGTAGTASSDVITVQGIASMTALKVDGSAVTQPVSGTVTANAGTNLNTSLLALESGGNLASIKTDVDNLNLSQGSTTSGQKGNLSFGAVTTSAPTYTTAQSNPLSLTTAGALRTDSSATTQPVSGTVTANAGTGTFNIQSNASVNVAQLAGNTISSGVGTSGTGTLRTVTANDTGRTLQSAGGSASSSGNNTLVAAGTNRLKVYAFTLSTTSTTAVTCIFQSGASGTELWRVVLQAPTSVSTGANLVVQPPAWLFATGTATLLNLNLSAAQAVHWSVSYWDEA